MNDEERLQKLYDTKDDKTLLEMWQNREDLTDAAQTALRDVMRERTLEPVEEPESVAEALQVASAVEANEVLLWSFGDMFQAKEAIQLLEEAQIEYKLVDLSKGADLTTWGSQSAWLQLLVAERDYGLAAQVLHDGMGLFPKAEMDAPNGDVGTLDDLMSVLMIDAETELGAGIAAARALAEKGISFLWHDGRDFPEGLADAHTVSIEVRPAAYESAAAVVADCMDVLPAKR